MGVTCQRLHHELANSKRVLRVALAAAPTPDVYRRWQWLLVPADLSCCLNIAQAIFGRGGGIARALHPAAWHAGLLYRIQPISLALSLAALQAIARNSPCVIDALRSSLTGSDLASNCRELRGL